jgi:peptidoglycan hydrolase-like protein with peptidoglycan-binding domain
MTQLQVNTGFGTFGNQTEKAVKAFQKDNSLQESGIVEAVNFKILFNQTEFEQASSENGFFVAKDGENYTVLANILMTKDSQTGRDANKPQVAGASGIVNLEAARERLRSRTARPGSTRESLNAELEAINVLLDQGLSSAAESLLELLLKTARNDPSQIAMAR